MKRYVLLPLLCGYLGLAQAAQPFKGTLYDSENKIFLHLDLYEESIEVPGMEMFGPMNGYMNGNLYGVWTITSSKIEDDKDATFRLSNDLGSETQEVKLTVANDSTYLLEQVDGSVLKKVVGKKLVKIPRDLTFHLRP
ncbi:MAG: hypothetical protein LUC45_01655 [Paraprevotella sp.]|nr:hypothetical protein [Paraprevotella sp.]